MRLLPAIVLALLASPAFGQELPCNERAVVLAHLGKAYSEAVIAAGVANSGGLIEILESPKGGTWTIIVTNSRGLSCMIAAGEGWRVRAYEPAGPDT